MITRGRRNSSAGLFSFRTNTEDAHVARARARQEVPSASDIQAAASVFDEAMPPGGIYAKSDEASNAAPALLIGLQLPTLAEKILFGSNVMLFGRMYEVYGPPGSCKSSFVYDRHRLVMQAGGKHVHIDVEDKDSPDLRYAVLGRPDNFDIKKWTRQADSMEAWMRSAYKYLDWFKDNCRKPRERNKPLGRILPFSFSVDSVVAKAVEEAQDKFELNQGAPTRRFGDEARTLTDWFKIFPRYMKNWPVIALLVNHDKPKPNPKNASMVTHHAPGGVSQAYHATFRLLTSKVRDIDRNAAGVEGCEIQIKLDKSSAGVTGSRVKVRFLWRFDHPEDGGPAVQSAWWDWDRATTETLYELFDTVGVQGRSLKAECGLKKAAGDMWSCPQAGIPHSDPMPADVVGRAINSNPELSAKLENILEIIQYPVFQPGVDAWEAAGCADV